MNELKVKKTQISKGERIKISLHQRIVFYKNKNETVANHLLAIKWIGNAASHFSGVTKDEALDAYEILEHSLDLLYNSKDRKIDSLAKKINNKYKNPSKKKKPKKE